MSAPGAVAVGVLASGSGTNLQALLDASQAADYPARVAVVISNRRAAGALQRARDAGVAAVYFPKRREQSRQDYDAGLVTQLRAHGVKWVCLAGYMRLVSPVFLAAWPDRVLNIHPALLPSFPGLQAQQQALQRGVRIAGATVHLVDGGCDTGPVICQGAVPVHPDDDVASLSARILKVEHQLYPRALAWAAQGRLVVVDGTVRLAEGGGEGGGEGGDPQPERQRWLWAD